MVPAPEPGGVEIRVGTGVLWRIRRASGPLGEVPRKPIMLPVNLFRLLLPPIGAAALLGVAMWALVRRLR
jgi:hypothetical protein